MRCSAPGAWSWEPGQQRLPRPPAGLGGAWGGGSSGHAPPRPRKTALHVPANLGAARARPRCAVIPSHVPAASPLGGGVLPPRKGVPRPFRRRLGPATTHEWNGAAADREVTASGAAPWPQERRLARLGVEARRSGAEGSGVG